MPTGTKQNSDLQVSGDRTEHRVVPGFLLLEDGALFSGQLYGADTDTVAEVVFTTGMTGYQEVASDPSFKGQIVVMTAPQIGNYGANSIDLESDRPQISGMVVRELSRMYSNWRAEKSLVSWLGESGVPILTEVDTRRLTRHLRSRGAMRGVIGAGQTPSEEATAALKAAPSMLGLDLATDISTKASYDWGDSKAPYHIIAYDFGVKRNMLRLLEESGCRVTVMPATTPVEDILAQKPNGIFLSNGPGDPGAIDYMPAVIRRLSDEGLPVFGICLGHQLIAHAFGGSTEKLAFGHRGANQPVKDLGSGRVLITAQNHGFSVKGDASGVDGAPDLEVTHINLNDGTVEGLRHRTRPVFGVQYHPEAAPGPHDGRTLFAQFIESLRTG